MGNQGTFRPMTPITRKRCHMNNAATVLRDADSAAPTSLWSLSPLCLSCGVTLSTSMPGNAHIKPHLSKAGNRLRNMPASNLSRNTIILIFSWFSSVPAGQRRYYFKIMPRKLPETFFPICHSTLHDELLTTLQRKKNPVILVLIAC